MDHELSPISLDFSNLSVGMEFLESVSLRNPMQAEGQLLRMLNTVMLSPPAPDILFQLLEQMRAPLCFIEEEIGRQFYNKPLPLSDEDEGRWRQVAGAWRKMSAAYQLCLSGARVEGAGLAENPGELSLATLLHRCLYYTGQYLLEHYRVRRELPEGVWLELHNLYRMAEVRGVALQPVVDALENDTRATCMSAYISLLLIDVANPYAHTQHNLKLIQRWATLWAPHAMLMRPPASGPVYGVEFDKDMPLHQGDGRSAASDEVRLLDTSRIASQIAHMQAQLHQRVTPAQLGLGEETGSDVIRLLGTLVHPWTQQPAPRRFHRFDATGRANVVSGFANMYFFISGHDLVQSDVADTYSRGEFDKLFTFREMIDPGQELTIKPHSAFLQDEWHVLNHSANGFRLGRGAAGETIAFGQLLAVLPHDGERYLLAQITWLMQDGSGGLIAGVATLPGLPKAVGVRLSQDGDLTTERYNEAFLLPPMPAIHEEGSLVIPAGLYKASCLLDVITGNEHWQVRMNHVLQRGSDFDRVSYQKL